MALPDYTNYQNPLQGHPFFDPNSNYQVPGQQGWQGGLPGAGQPGQNAFNTWATNESPQGYFFGEVSKRGYGGLDARSQAAQGLYGKYSQGYQAAKGKNMELYFPDYMNMQDLDYAVNSMSDEQLGIDRKRFAGNRRWGLRSV